ncbi:VOC family protein [Lysobacter sp.]|uniref:VOC family protein n=1 Tax=Lysobacter sp. TaxID=72226 RepID=UPI002D57B8F2|nr:VOC family protein [Lysobacter sp.]HZX76661.1 VOC family protein [Lysobacter sp.]
MATQIFVNLPCKDLPRSKAFFESLGYSFNPDFTDDNAASMVVTDGIYVMLLTEPFFAGFTKKPVADAHKTTEAIVCLSLDSREAVDEIVAKAVAGGAKTPNAPQDHGFMYGHGFEDLDGHLWEFVHMSGMPPKAE